MKLKKFKRAFGGTTAVMASVLTLSSAAYAVAMSPLAQGWVDGFFGVETREVWGTKEVEGVQHYKKDHKTVKEYAEALKEHAAKQGEEGFALLKNDNSALPLATNRKVALFGWNSYNIPTGHTGVVAGNKDSAGGPWGQLPMKAYLPQVTLAQALRDIEGITVNETIKSEDFPGAMTKAPGYATYTIPEVFDVKDTWNIQKEGTTAIVAVGRGGGEGANYKVDDATGAKDPLALSTEELEMIAYAKEHCEKVVVLVVSANAMELGPIIKGGTHEVDAIGFCGIPNDYQYIGIANVLAGKANATGALTDTYVYDNSFTPASVNMGEQSFQDTNLIAIGSEGDAIGRKDLSAKDLKAEKYIVEAEGIYVGYKYYETRYFDSYANPSSNATDKIGSTNGSTWNYKNEVIFPFGHTISYIPYEQEITNVEVDLSENGQTKATIKVTNKGDKKGKFLAQLYVSRPYTEYDKKNNIEKSAIDFLNSVKVEVEANSSKEVTITLPTRYLASWDSKGSKTYIMDEGDYHFTAAAGSHEAVNNVLTALGKETDKTTTSKGVKTWNLRTRDTKTFSKSNGHQVTNVADNIDINYYLDDKVTYLTRQDWKTYPKNYTNVTTGNGILPEPAFRLSDSSKKDEWINELRNLQYIPTTDKPTENIEGILPEDVGEGKDYKTSWDRITSFKLRNPEAFNDVNSEIWNQYAAAMNINEAAGAILHGGNTTDTLSVGNPTSAQSESVSGYSQQLTIIPAESEDGVATKMVLNVASNTLLGSSFNPELALEWGKIEGEGGLWLQDETGKGPITVWGAGLNLHRHAYNGRNSEYMSEDPMLTNRIGEAQLKGAMSKGAIVGPKHMGFNDQELNRQGNGAYMTEQKMRETDIRCYEGALRKEEGNGNGVMMSFSRIGATNVTNHTGLMIDILREEWGFDGISTTDMGMKWYHEPYSIINATINQYAGFGANDSFIGEKNNYNDSTADKTWDYVTMKVFKNDNYLSEKARETNKYQHFTLAHSANVNIRIAEEGEKGETQTLNVYLGKIDHAPWEYIFISITSVTAVFTALSGAAWIASSLIRKED